MAESTTKGKLYSTKAMPKGLKRNENRKGFEAMPVFLKHLEQKLINILGRANVFSFVVGTMHKR